ncbi:SDR family oxidoreductase [Aromatoleum sp.]|uniref:SDR family oxidoreductase n=1 Tax=Aromatoleum sp. TaxID=2307007 RepID=UPI002FC88A91
MPGPNVIDKAAGNAMVKVLLAMQSSPGASVAFAPAGAARRLRPKREIDGEDIMAIRIEDAVVAITGASSGIGRAAALRFAAEGAKLILVARRERVLRALCDECRRRGGQAIAIAADVADEAALRGLVDRAVGTYGRIDAWINNAGVLMVGKFDDCPSEAYRRVIETNLFGYIHGARAVLPLFHRQGRGTLINVASLGGRVGVPYRSAYSASEFAILGWSDSLRRELALDGTARIDVCTVVPAHVDTPLLRQAANFSGRGIRPVGPVDSPEKVARALVRAVRHPRGEIVVGAATRLALLGLALAPRLVGRLLAFAFAREQFAPTPAAIGCGNVLHPAPGSASVHGGWRKEVRARDAFGRLQPGH